MAHKCLPLVLLALLIEDERDMYGHYLRVRGFRVATALDGGEAIKMAHALAPDAVVVGQRLPPGGEQVCRELRRTPATCLIPLLLLASYEVPREVADAVLIRPVPPETLSLTLRLLIASSDFTL